QRHAGHHEDAWTHGGRDAERHRRQLAGGPRRLGRALRVGLAGRVAALRALAVDSRRGTGLARAMVSGSSSARPRPGHAAFLVPLALAFVLRLLWVVAVPTRPVGDFALYVESAAHLLEHRALDAEFI